MPASPSSSPLDPVDLQLHDAGIAATIALPRDWSREIAPVPNGEVFHDAAGRLHPRLTATSADGLLHLHLSASRFQPPSLVSAVVYWAQLHGFASELEEDRPWGGCAALGGWSSLESDPTYLAAAVWIEAHGAVIELKLVGPRDAQVRMRTLWEHLHAAFECAALPAMDIAGDAVSPWWTRAKTLREQGRLDEAIELIERDGDIAEALLMQADLHAARMHRALASGEREIAIDAWRRAVACARDYASCATSGGEGVARSLDRDRVLAELGPEPHA